ncbi:DegT/DnrJ/EryC1/StrS family aminotransferase [Methanoculleus sp. FWC-SCC1]|uniref:DegT/DnrJ/EryC1/StrS family aminotransferase n=1 Tax=Methanoculleus frigidifontis TaxID=2584085 RepID=A0ABT8M7N3_9EURY|nr:DegT/DnrJ/EryC1/StrS family aminotransferase [Methanoculleus sp. FWC-SCC1]
MPGYELIGEEEACAVKDVFTYGGVLTRYGHDRKRRGIYRVEEFERAFSRRMGVRHALAVSSGSAALIVALRALGVGDGDEVITQSYTFVATLEAIAACGGVPVVTEIDATLTMDPDDLAARITDRTKAIVPVHTMGIGARMDAILRIAREHGIPVLEDAAQACGGSYHGELLGTIGNVGCFSFDFEKVITTGEGGMIVTDDGAIIARARACADHGREMQDPHTPADSDPHPSGGFNFRMSELSGAVGLAQLPKMDTVIRRQREIKRQIQEGLSDTPGLTFREVPDPTGDAGNTAVFFLESREAAAAFARCWRERGHATQNLPDSLAWDYAAEWSHILGGYPRYRGRKISTLWPQSRAILERGIAIPLQVTMTPDAIDRLIAAARACAGTANLRARPAREARSSASDPEAHRGFRGRAGAARCRRPLRRGARPRGQGRRSSAGRRSYTGRQPQP